MFHVVVQDETTEAYIFTNKREAIQKALRLAGKKLSYIPFEYDFIRLSLKELNGVKFKNIDAFEKDDYWIFICEE